MSGNSNWCLHNTERIIFENKALFAHNHLIIGMTRVRNESLILSDTLDHICNYVDAIVAYDDASTDQTLDILINHPKTALVISNSLWETDILARITSETRHRGLLLKIAQEKLQFKWVLCFDADERYIGDIRSFISGPSAANCVGVRISLFDAYMTDSDHSPYSSNQKLLNFRRFFGPEKRNILMLWENSPKIYFEGLDAREPMAIGQVENQFYCQHYAKALSIEHWEETCDYYIKHFPFETYGQKWFNRKAEQSIASLISVGPYLNGELHFLKML